MDDVDSEAGWPSDFLSYKLYVAYGEHGRFDFVVLPSGSLAYYAVNQESAIRLTRNGKEVESIIHREWGEIPKVDIVEFIGFVLEFYDDGIHRSHQVLRDADELRSMDGEHRTLNASAIAPIEDKIGKTELQAFEDHYCVRAITLCGWMHDKQELGIESITIDRNGHVSLGQRQILCATTFLKLPEIMY